MAKTRKVKVEELDRGEATYAGRWATYCVLIGREQHGRVTVSERGETHDGTVFLSAREADVAIDLARAAFRASLDAAGQQDPTRREVEELLDDEQDRGGSGRRVDRTHGRLS